MDTIRIGILYDFDKTLCTTDMQEYDFIKNLGMTSDAFWGEAAAITAGHEVEKILAYMFVMIKKCKEKGIPLTDDDTSVGKVISEKVFHHGKSLCG